MIAEAFLRIADLGIAVGAAPMTRFVGKCWEHQVDDTWWIAVNANKESVECSRGAMVPFGYCYVECNGWPAGMFTPTGGLIASGEVANEDAFIGALDRAICAVKAPTDYTDADRK